MKDLRRSFSQARRLSGERGFTLIELLVVIAIIAILAAIAIPQFAKYRVRAFNAAAESDLRTIRTTMEAIYADVQTYGNDTVSVQTGTLTISAGGISETVKLSTNVYAGIRAGDVEFVAVSGHRDGDKAFCVDSDMSPIYWKTKDRGKTTSTDIPLPSLTSGAGDDECDDNYSNTL